MQQDRQSEEYISDTESTLNTKINEKLRNTKKKYDQLKIKTKKWYDYSLLVQDENCKLKEKLSLYDIDMASLNSSLLEKNEVNLNQLETLKDIKLYHKDVIKELQDKHKDELMELKYNYREKISDLKNDVRLKEGEIQNVQRTSQETIKYWESQYKDEMRKNRPQ